MKAKNKVFLIIAFFALLGNTAFAQKIFNIKDYGAISSDTTTNTAAIQKTIDACAAKGGGTVLIPNGTFLSGTIFLKSNVSLMLSPGALLKGSVNMKDYNARTQLEREGLVCASNQNNIGIYGTGTINGQGENKTFYSSNMKQGLPNRPNCIAFHNCTNIKLKDFTLRNSAHWSIDIKNCDSVLADGIKVLSNVVANNDGIDLTDCHNVTVVNSYFDCGDDGICPKSDSKRGVKNLVINNCKVKSQSNGIKFGTTSVGGFADVKVTNCVITDTRLSGLALEMVDGGVMERISISNISMNKVNGAIFIKIGNRKGVQNGILRDVTLTNITADSIGFWKPNKKMAYHKDAADQRIGVSIVGQPGNYLNNITLSNINLRFAGGGQTADANIVMPDAPSVYPEYTNFGITPAYGLNIRHAKNIELNGIKLRVIKPDARPAMFIEDADGVTIKSLEAQNKGAQWAIRFKDVNTLLIQDVKTTNPNITFAAFEGNIKNVKFINNSFEGDKIYTLRNGANADEISGVPKVKSAAARAVKSDSRFEIYLLMGQSNMAGRGPITPEMVNEGNDSVLVLNQAGEWVKARHPLHYDKPGVAAAGPGLMFGMKMAEANPTVKIGLVPCAVGGTSIEKWLPGAYDEATKTHPYDDAVERITTAMKYGIVKGVIWHQGEANSSAQKVPLYLNQLKEFITRVRKLVGNLELPFVAGELGYFGTKHNSFNIEIVKLPELVPNTAVVSANGLTDKGDHTHFDGSSADELGRRYAEKMLELQKLQRIK